ncbi:hypothetical protein ACHQM5_026303 [Ranunculus cassubicifolius]
MVQEGIVYWNDTKGGCGGFSTPEDSQRKLVFPGKKDSVFSVYGREVESKKVKLMEYDESHQQNEEKRVFDGSRSPLGLSLKKTPSFAELIEAKLLQAKNTSHESSDCGARKRKRDEDQKMKATSWNAKLLRIGTWERRALRDQDLVAKCYYQKRKLVWEMLDGALKNKIEVQWSDITAIRASFPQHKNAVLEIQVRNIPLFCRETPPQPRKHTSWHPTSDFTGGEAPKYRRHYLQFEEGTLQPHYEKLLQCDKRLFTLSRQPFPVNESPYFSIDMSGSQDYYFKYNRLQPEVLQFSQCGIQGTSYVPLPQTQSYVSAAENPLHGTPSPYPLMPVIVQPLSFQYPQSTGNVLPGLPSTNSLLDDIANNLLHAPIAPTCPDEQKLMARIKSMCNLLELSHEQTQLQNTDISDVDYSYSTNNSTPSRSSGDSNENWVLVTGPNENTFVHHQRIPSFSNLYFDQAFEQFGTPNSGMNNMRCGSSEYEERCNGLR